MPLGGALPYDEAGGLETQGLDASEQKVIEMLQQIAQEETDNARSAELTDIIAKLYKILASDEDAQMSAAGGNPKQLRALGRTYGA